MNRTSIPWVKNPDNKTQGYTWNPLTGCLNHVNGICNGGGFPCYAYKLANTRLKLQYLSNTNFMPPRNDVDRLSGGDPFYPRFWEDKLYHAWNGKPKGIFVCDMSDLFGIDIPEDWTAKVMNLIRLHEENRYYLLTKQPQNLVKWSPFPPNCYVGVTACNQAMLNEALLTLEQVEAKIRFLSIEPFVDEFKLVPPHPDDPRKQIIDWVIIGSQTKPVKHPAFEWVENIVNSCKQSGVAVFIKPPLSDAMNLHLEEMP